MDDIFFSLFFRKITLFVFFYSVLKKLVYVFINNDHLTRRLLKMYKITIEVEKCVGCGECVDICPEEVFELQDEKAVAINDEDCVGCESCVEACEEEAITVEEQ